MNPKALSPRPYLDESLPLIPRLLQLLDRDPTSPTYGCFDRSFWHFRTMDFPSGMSQEFCYPLALVSHHPLENNPWHREPRLREWAIAGIDFAMRSAHKDGSCDDYYPYERALGAVVFSLYAMAETYRLLEVRREDLEGFLLKRARWVAGHGESGVLTNHHAIAAAALQSVAEICDDDPLRKAAAAKAREVLGHQHEEGWYREYDGFDPGYQTVTIDFLARYHASSGDDSVLPSLERALALLERVQHPDGGFGGEYASRNTYHCQPHGFELLAERFPAAGRLADRFLGLLAEGNRPRNDDDRLLGHHLYPYLLAWIDHRPRPEPPAPPRDEHQLLPACGFLIHRKGDDLLLAGLRKGGPFRLYRQRKLIANDSGPCLRLRNGDLLVAHLSHDAEVEEKDGEMIMETVFQVAKREGMTPIKAMILRSIMLTVGRFARTLVRRLLQRRLITGRQPTPYHLRRRFLFEEEELRVIDEIWREGPAAPVEEGWFAVGQTSIYIAVSHPWEQGWLLPWTSMGEEIATLNREGRCRLERKFPSRP